MTTKKILRYAGPLAGLILFCLAVMVLRKELHQFHYHDLVREFHAIPNIAVLIALAFTFLNYAVLSLYEILGFRYIRNKLPWYRVALTSFIAFAFSNNVGFYSISGSAVRFRMYSEYGLSALDISRLVLFSSGIAFWLGLCTVCSLVFLIEPIILPPFLHLSSIPHQIFGLVFLAPLIVFLTLSIVRKKPLRIREWEFEMPTPSLTLSLVVTSCCDWLLFAAILFSLLPLHEMTFLSFLGLFFVAQLAGLISHVPGGLGVFETMFLLLLPASVDRPSTFGALMVFRVLYYLLPLGASALILGGLEVFHKRQQVGRITRQVSEWSSSIIPPVFAVAVFAGGVILLFSGATPGVPFRMEWLMRFMPLPILELSHFLGSVAGVMLLILSWGIYRRLDSAYMLSLIFLCGGVILSLLKGLDYEEAVILTATALALWPCKSHFYRKSSFIHDRFSFGWFIGIIMVLAGSLWLGFFSYKHVDYAHELWWRFSFESNASRFLRATAGIAVALIGFGLLRLLSRGKHVVSVPCEEDMSVVRSVLATSERSSANLALLGDKSFLISDKKDAFVMYGVQGKSWIAMGDPVGKKEAVVPLIWKYRELCDEHDGRPVFYEVGRENLHLYIDIGLTLIKMGENARVDLRGFSLDGGSKKSFRYILRKLEQEGWQFEIIPAIAVPGIIDQLKKVSDSWLVEKKSREKRFSLGNFSEPYLKQLPCAIVRKNNDISAFANIWTSGNGAEMSIDLMRYGPDAPKGVMDFLFLHLMTGAKAQGVSWFDLGMAPFSGMENRPLAPLWSRLAAVVYSYGENFYNFQGLHQFKEKFGPIWEPVYIACPAGISLPAVLRDSAALVSGGMKGVIAK
jgi:phosphatidylglycerol lysyltransferase